MGIPKALVLSDDGVPWVVSASRMLREAGCADIFVTLGAESVASQAHLSSESVHIVEVADWSIGISASIRAGVQTIAASDADCCLIHLVDLPDVGSDVARRVIEGLGGVGLARAAFHGRPGHPVAIARKHWRHLLRELSGDEGAGAYLTRNHAIAIECADLATGADVDTRPNQGEARTTEPGLL